MISPASYTHCNTRHSHAMKSTQALVVVVAKHAPLQGFDRKERRIGSDNKCRTVHRTLAVGSAGQRYRSNQWHDPVPSLHISWGSESPAVHNFSANRIDVRGWS